MQDAYFFCLLCSFLNSQTKPVLTYAKHQTVMNSQ